MKKLFLVSSFLFVRLFLGELIAQCTANVNLIYSVNPGEISITDFSQTDSGPNFTTSWINFMPLNLTWSQGLQLQPITTSTTYQFYENGTFMYKAYVTDNITNCIDSTYGTFTISNLPVSCNSNFNYSQPYSTYNAVFQSASNSANAVYQWNFGDGNSGFGSSPTHTYSTYGEYTVCLIVSDNSTNTCTDTTCQSVVINMPNNAGLCDATFYGYAMNDSTANFYSIGNNTPSAQYYWSINGNVMGNGQNYTHTYTNGGWQHICLTVVDSLSLCYALHCDSVFIPGNSPANTLYCHASFVMVEDSLQSNLYHAWNLSFGSNITYLWDFGDGTTSTLPYPTHEYSAPGIYTICLTIISDNNCQSTYCFTLDASQKLNTAIINVMAPGQFTSSRIHLSMNDWKLFPNPNNGQFSLAFDSPIAEKLTVKIINFIGQELYSTQLNVVSGQNQHSFNGTDLSSGLYFLTITNSTSQKIYTTKFIKD
jgi:PKD repeat protein